MDGLASLFILLILGLSMAGLGAPAVSLPMQPGAPPFTISVAGLLTLATAVASCVLTEHWICRASGKPSTIGDWSAVITGLLYGLTLPPGRPLWMVAAGGILAVADYLSRQAVAEGGDPVGVGR